MDDLDVQGINSTCICRSMSASSQTSLYPTVFCSVGNIYLLTSLGILSEKAMAPHSSTLAWKIPWMEEPGRLQSMGSLGVGHDWATSLSLFTFTHWRRKWKPTPVFLPGESQGQGSLVGCRLWGRRVGHDWSDLAAAAASEQSFKHPVYPWQPSDIPFWKHLHEHSVLNITGQD